MLIGDVAVAPVLDHTARIDPGLLFDKTPEEWEPHRQFLDADGKLQLDFGGFLIRAGAQLVLVDLGMGLESASGPGQMLSNLQAFGVATSDVTDVVFTHLHFDHVGWASDGTAATFPNAIYRCDVRDWEFFVGPDAAFVGHGPQDPSPGRIKHLLGPVGERLETWDRDTTVAPGVDVVRAPGHTPGVSAIVLSGGAARAMLLGDIVHCPAELLEDDWAMMADVDSELAQRTRESLARELEGEDVAIAGAHFPDLQFGRLLRGRSTRSWVFNGAGGAG